MSGLAHIGKRLREQSGVVAVEFLVVVFAWVLALSFLINISLLLGNAMIMQGAANRLALRASAQGCVSNEAIDAVRSNPFLASNVAVSAVAARAGVDQNFDRQAALDKLDRSGSDALCEDPLGGIFAGSDGRDLVPENDYIYVVIDYSQQLWLFPDVRIRKSALATSSSFNRQVSG
jgi:hypothetical protein